MVTLFTKSASGEKADHLGLVQRIDDGSAGALDIDPLGFRARLDVAGYSLLMGAD